MARHYWLAPGHKSGVSHLLRRGSPSNGSPLVSEAWKSAIWSMGSRANDFFAYSAAELCPLTLMRMGASSTSLPSAHVQHVDNRGSQNWYKSQVPKHLARQAMHAMPRCSAVSIGCQPVGPCQHNLNILAGRQLVLVGPGSAADLQADHLGSVGLSCWQLLRMAAHDTVTPGMPLACCCKQQ